MARPPKKPGLRMDADLRIPVSTDQKALIQRGAVAAGQDMATWARPILLEAAERQIAKQSVEK